MQAGYPSHSFISNEAWPCTELSSCKGGGQVGKHREQATPLPRIDESINSRGWGPLPSTADKEKGEKERWRGGLILQQSSNTSSFANHQI